MDSAMNAYIMELIRQNPEIDKKIAGAGTAPADMEMFLERCAVNLARPRGI